MSDMELYDILKEKVVLFHDFPKDKLLALLDGSRVMTFEANEAVIEFGKEGLFLGVIIEGQAELSITDDRGDKHVIEIIGPGDLFGVPSLMTGNKTMSDVIGLTRCKALLIPQYLFANLVATHLPAITLLSKILVERFKNYPGGQDQNQDVADAALRRSDDPYGFQLKTDHPMKILVINCGVRLFKYEIFDTADEGSWARGTVQPMGQEHAVHVYQSRRGVITERLPYVSHRQAMEAMMAALTSSDKGMVASPLEITAIGHRVVHGGSKFRNSVLITSEVIQQIESVARLAPMHNPYNLIGIREAGLLFPQAPQVAVFDTSFHQTMPPYAYLYGLPYEYYEKKGIRRYGFHGMSHQYVALKVAEYLKRPFNELETIVCHLGNGASICGVDHGRSVDTSMGFTPVEGLIMGTRCGDLDPGLLLHLIETENLSPRRLFELLHNDSGLFGLSGLSPDMAEIEEAATRGDHRCMLAIKTFAYRVRKYIGGYVAVLGGLHVLAFSGKIGQNSVGVRSLACQGLSQMGIRIDERKNRAAVGLDYVFDISADDSKVKVLVVPQDEARMIARSTLRAIARSHVASIIENQGPVEIPIEISAHHVHLSTEHVVALFGPGHELTPINELSQPGQFACAEKVNLVGPKGQVNNVRVLGPVRKQTQVEIAMTEQFKLGVDAPIRESGSIAGTPGLTLEGPGGRVPLDNGVICALRHIHMTPQDALSFGLKDKDIVRVRVPGERELIFGDVLVRVSPSFKLAMHIDTDEGNAANIATGATGFIDGLQSRR